MEGYIYGTGVKSTAQQRFIEERTAALVEARRQRRISQDGASTTGSGPGTVTGLERTTTNTSGITASTKNSQDQQQRHWRHNSYGEMPPPLNDSSANSSQSEVAHRHLLNHPYELKHDRRYLRDLPYPLPVDLLEVQRQNLRTLLTSRVLGSPVCSPAVKDDVPRRVLEIACGSGHWSALCHDHFRSLGQKNVSFTGLDVAPLPPDLTKQGVNWTFVQHDLRRVPLPFDDEQFDLVMLKDVSLVVPIGPPFQKLLDESIRVLSEGGTLEMWETDHVVRSLLPHPSILSRQHVDHKTAIETATFLISPATPFTPTQNRYLQQSNEWIQEALDRKKLPSTPCAGIANILHQEPESLADIGSRRIAIPFGELRWERDGAKHSQFANDRHDSVISKGKARVSDKALTVDQAAIRQIALLTTIQMIESLEPLLKEASGQNAEEWAGWWAAMMSQIMDPSKATLNGECLEIGAWWATKRTRD